MADSDRILRLTSRLIVVDEQDRILLMMTAAPDTSGFHRWITPGGGVDPGETHRDAAIRELHEETGQVIDDPGQVVHTEDFETPWDAADHTHGHAEYYVIRLPHFEVVDDDWTDDEKVDITESRWFTVDELDALDPAVDPYEPSDLVPLVRRVLAAGAGV